MRYQLMVAILVLLFNGCTDSGPGKDGSGGPAALVSGDTVTVSRIIKGDEIVVHKGREQANVRLIGIHAFSTEVPDNAIVALAKRSSDFLRQKIVDATIQLTFDSNTKDVYGRYLAYVTINGIDINRLLLENGLAVVYTEFPFTRQADYFGAEQAAMRSRLEVWGSADMVTVVRGLRQQWDKARAGKSRTPMPDPLLTQPSQGL